MFLIRLGLPSIIIERKFALTALDGLMLGFPCKHVLVIFFDNHRKLALSVHRASPVEAWHGIWGSPVVSGCFVIFRFDFEVMYQLTLGCF